MQILTAKAADKTKYLAEKTGCLVAPITEIFTNGFFTVDRKWIVQYWNKAAEKILRVKAEDIVGKNLWKKFAGIIPIELLKIDQRTFLKDVPVHFNEYWGEMDAWFDVTTYHCDNTLSVSFKSSNHPLTKKDEDPVQQLKVISELYRHVTEITNDCLWEWDLQAKDIFWIDGGHKRMFGYTVENALIPQTFWESCIHPNDKERVLTHLKEMLNGKTNPLWEAEYRFKKADGSYRYVHDRGRIIYDEYDKAVRMIGATQDITEKVLLHQKLAQEVLAKQRRVTDAILIAQEKERNSIGTELNENLNQLLVVIKWYVQMAKTDDKRRDNCIDKSTEYLNHVIAEIRKMYKELVIPDIKLSGLSENIKSLIHDKNKTQLVNFRFYKEGIDDEEDIDKNMQQDIYRMVQEQLNNILKHAHANSATINLSKQDNNIILSITDNGQGCDTTTEKNGVGIINITSRAELYNGTVTITTKPGRGYTLKIVFPCYAVAL